MTDTIIGGTYSLSLDIIKSAARVVGNLSAGTTFSRAISYRQCFSAGSVDFGNRILDFSIAHISRE